MKRKFQVSVEKVLYYTGKVEIVASSAEEAKFKVVAAIISGALTTSQVDWDDGEYEDLSFAVTGDVD